MSETFRMVPAGEVPWICIVAIGLVILGVLVLFCYIGYSARNTKFIVSSEGLQITGTLYGRLIPRDRLQPHLARPVNLELESEFRPSWRTNGLGLPGYQAGWFKLKNSEKALLFLTNKKQAVYIPTIRGYSLLLSVPDPEKFVEALRTTAGQP